MSDQYPPTGGGPPPQQNWPPPGGPGGSGPGGPDYGNPGYGGPSYGGSPQGGPPYGGPPQGGAFPNYPYGQPQADAPGATTALVLGILGLVVCGVLAPFAWYYGNRALEEIELSGRTLGGHGNAKAGQIMGIIGTILLGVGLVFGIIWIIAVASIANSNDDFDILRTFGLLL
jgi:Domain of unknown function (DUF4190)